MRLSDGSETRPSLRAFGSGARLDAASRRGFSGTFDFKWPLGSRIRVIFQEPAFGDRGLARAAGAIVEETAKKWLGGANIDLDFATHRDRYFPRPPFPLEPCRYDVLVSLDDLPVRLPEKKGQPQEEMVELPSAMLGTYALRMDYGDPTVYLGWRPRQPAASARERAAYFESAPFRGGVLHEFGHVLGLGHEHQNPLRYPPDRPEAWPPWASESEITDAIERRWGLRVDAAFIRSEITEAWPCARDAEGRPLYSDWRAPETAEFDSVMVVPGYREFFRAPHRREDDPQAWLARHAAPTASDLACLSATYPHARL